MYEIRRYTETNSMGAATLLEALVSRRGSVRKLLVSSSCTVYGEGSYSCPTHGPVHPGLRSERQLAARQWEVLCPTCETPVAPRPTPEDKPLYPASIYAATKRQQEDSALVVGHAYGIPTVVLRFFNIYGSRQALSNPYTGVATIFCSRMLNNHAPYLFEDGLQSRDLTHVSDVVRGCVQAIERPEADFGIFNLGSGHPCTMLDVARTLASRLGWDGTPEIAGTFRAGDVRHTYADLERARAQLGYEPQVMFEQGVDELIGWVAKQHGIRDRFSAVASLLVRRGLTL
jgi:dTDP-L-rhamnose 4-epimerase